MAKLGYTWYPKDWGNSEKVFELDLSERGLYRELIDMAMQSDNKIEINLNVWSRKFNSDCIILDLILDKLIKLKLIEKNDETIFIPSCEPRLNLIRGGSKGGKNKGNNKPNDKPNESLLGNNDKPTINQIEKESKKKYKVKEIIIPDYLEFKNYAIENKPNVCLDSLKLKYDSWIANDWKNGNDKKISNWKTALLNTLPYIKEKAKQDTIVIPQIKMGTR